MATEHWDRFLRPTAVLDWTDPTVLALARDLNRGGDQLEVARRCFTWVRDEIGHTVDVGAAVVTCAASEVVRAGTGFWYAKSHLLAALLRANWVPTGLCYQRLSLENEGFCLHGLAAAWLPAVGWYRIDPRGNRPGINAQFIPPTEQVVFPIRQAGERPFPRIYADPAPPVLRTLRSVVSVDSV